jgi:hypothetical protein
MALHRKEIMPKIQIDPDRFDDLLGDEFFGFFEGNPIWLYKALSHFVLADSQNGSTHTEYMAADMALTWLKSNFTLREVKELRSEFLKSLQERAVPLAKEKQSETQL